MKVGIVTMHRVDNYGAALQAYATCESIRFLGGTPEIIDYIPNRFRLSRQLLNVRADRAKTILHKALFIVASAPIRLKIWHSFTSFVEQTIPLSKKKYYNIKSMENQNIYDVYLTGSDQVWNSDFDHYIDPVFYLEFAPAGAKKVAYAASFGKKQLSEDEIPVISGYLRKYNRITVRESEGVDILHSLDLEGEQVLDPTLLLCKEQWQNVMSKRLVRDKYILIYQLNPNPEFEKQAKIIAKSKGLKIVKLGRDIKKAKYVDYQFSFRSPKDFLSLFTYADYVLTDSFHGTAFSINFERNFTVIYPPRFSGRLKSILDLTGQEERTNIDNHNINIDYSVVTSIIRRERQKSLDALKSMISLEGDNE